MEHFLGWWRVSAGIVIGSFCLALVPSPAPSCSLCAGLAYQAQPSTLRQEAMGNSARLILFGTLANPQVKPGGNGVTDLIIHTILRDDAALTDKKKLELPRFVPVNDPKNPPHFLVFCDVFQGKIDPYRGIPFKGTAGVDYLKKTLALNAKDRIGNLIFFFDYLDAAEPEVARDAYLEFSKATDAEVGQVAPRLSAERLRQWLQDSKTPPERLGLYAFLLGGAGGPRDAALLRSLLKENNDRVINACDGILSGLIHLDPREGWAFLQATLSDNKRPLPMRLTLVRTLRFYHGWKPTETRTQVLAALRAILNQGELADLAVEDLRRWKMWDLTNQVLALNGKKGFDAPLMRRAIVRYALSCGDEPSRRFIASRRQEDRELVKDVEESLQYEKGK